MLSFSEKIRKRRKEMNLTQTELAKILFVTKQAVSKWENGKGYPDTITLTKLANVLDISLDNLLTNKRNTKKYIYVFWIVFMSGLLLIILFLSHTLYTNHLNRQLISVISNEIGYSIPTKGKISEIDFSEWIELGNEIEVYKMCYIVYDNENILESLKQDIIIDERWIGELSIPLIKQTPDSLSPYISSSDYFLLYNITTGNINYEQEVSGLYSYYLLCYQEENNRIIIFSYYLEI